MNSLSRRSFLAATSGLGLSLLGNGFPRTGRASPGGLPAGIQLWTVNDSLKTNPALTLQTLQKIGYRSVETAGFAICPRPSFASCSTIPACAARARTWIS